MYFVKVIDDEKKMKEIESKRKGAKPQAKAQYPEGVRRDKVELLNMLPAMNELEEDKKLLSSGKFSNVALACCLGVLFWRVVLACCFGVLLWCVAYWRNSCFQKT